MKMLLSIAALAVSLSWASNPARAQNFVYMPPICYPIETRQGWIAGGFEVAETITQPGIDIHDIVTWETWVHTSHDLYAVTSRTDERICVYEEGRGTTPPKIHDRVEDTRDKPQGTAL
ncbi:MAG: hypothetical protein AAFQ04_09070 [Pseudomonadota bacterium]